MDVKLPDFEVIYQTAMNLASECYVHDNEEF